MTLSHPWAVTSVDGDPGDPAMTHTWPLGDLVGHDLDVDCICGPEAEEVVPGSWLVSHHSLDGREHEGRSNNDNSSLAG